MTENTAARPQPQRDIRKPVLDLLTESYAIGPEQDRRPAWPSGPHDEPWTEGEAGTAVQFAMSLFLMLAWEVDAAQIESRAVSVAEFLQTYQLMLKLAETGDPVQQLKDLNAALQAQRQGGPG
jgi:hypothetical protein